MSTRVTWLSAIIYESPNLIICRGVETEFGAVGVTDTPIFLPPPSPSFLMKFNSYFPFKI